MSRPGLLSAVREVSGGFTVPEVGDTWRTRAGDEVGVNETAFGGALVLHDGSLRDKFGRHHEDKRLDLVKLVARGHLREVRVVCRRRK